MPLKIILQNLTFRQGLFNLADLHLGDFRGLQRNPVNGLALAGVGHGGINLCSGDVLVAEDMLDGIDAGASLNL